MVPAFITAGDTLSLTKPLPDYPAGVWTLKLRLVGLTAGGTLEVTYGASGTDHAVTVPASSTAGLAAGQYGWAAWVESGGAVHTVATGQLQVRPNPRGAAAYTDLRSPARKALDDAVAAAMAWSPQRRRYRIGDREMEFGSMAELQAHITFLRGEVRREEQAAGGGRHGRRVYVRLARA